MWNARVLQNVNWIFNWKENRKKMVNGILVLWIFSFFFTGLTVREKKINCATLQNWAALTFFFFPQPFVGSVIVASLPESNQGLKIQPFLTGSICYCPSTTSRRLLILPSCSLESPSVSSLAETFVSSIKLRLLSCFGGGIILHGSGILCRRTSVAFLSHLESYLPILTGRQAGRQAPGGGL